MDCGGKKQIIILGQNPFWGKVEGSEVANNCIKSEFTLQCNDDFFSSCNSAICHYAMLLPLEQSFLSYKCQNPFKYEITGGS